MPIPHQCVENYARGYGLLTTAMASLVTVFCTIRFNYIIVVIQPKYILISFILF